jgi:hypothetical protein
MKYGKVEIFLTLPKMALSCWLLLRDIKVQGLFSLVFFVWVSVASTL